MGFDEYFAIGLGTFFVCWLLLIFIATALDDNFNTGYKGSRDYNYNGKHFTCFADYQAYKDFCIKTDNKYEV